jgi:phosphoribosylglycinamide formyltransferase-1
MRVGAMFSGRRPWCAMTIEKKRVAVLISGRGSNMAALIAAAKGPSYPAEIVLVLSSRPQAAGLLHAQAAGIATAIIDHTRYGRERECFERDMQKVLEQHRIELVCLAGFMRLLTPSFVRRWEGRMLNVHPALLPAFKGLDTHQRALDAGVRIHGASVHFVVAEMDSGPIVAQGALAVRADDKAEALAARVLEIEHRIYPMALGLLAGGRLRVIGERCIVEGEAAVRDCLIVPAPEDRGQMSEDR